MDRTSTWVRAESPQKQLMDDVRQIYVSCYVMRFEFCARIAFNNNKRPIKEQVLGSPAPVGNTGHYKSIGVECRPFSTGPKNLQYDRVLTIATDDKDWNVDIRNLDLSVHSQ